MLVTLPCNAHQAPTQHCGWNVLLYHFAHLNISDKFRRIDPVILPILPGMKSPEPALGLILERTWHKKLTKVKIYMYLQDLWIKVMFDKTDQKTSLTTNLTTNLHFPPQFHSEIPRRRPSRHCLNLGNSNLCDIKDPAEVEWAFPVTSFFDKVLFQKFSKRQGQNCEKKITVLSQETITTRSIFFAFRKAWIQVMPFLSQWSSTYLETPSCFLASSLEGKDAKKFIWRMPLYFEKIQVWTMSNVKEQITAFVEIINHWTDVVKVPLRRPTTFCSQFLCKNRWDSLTFFLQTSRYLFWSVICRISIRRMSWSL